MRCLVVGADRLGSAPKTLKDKFGVTKIIHWTGRKQAREIRNLSLIVIYTGFANHGIVNEAKKIAKKFNVKTVFVNRGLSELAAS